MGRSRLRKCIAAVRSGILYIINIPEIYLHLMIMHHYKFAISMFSRLSSRIYSSKCLLNQHQIKLGENNICTTGTFGIMMPVNRLHEAGQPAS